MASVGTAFVTIRADTTGFGAQVTAAASAAAAQGEAAFSTRFARVGSSLSTIGAAMTRSLTLPIAGIGIATGVMAANFESAFARIEGLVGVPAAELDRMRQSVLALATETGQSPQRLAEGLFFVTSAGLRGNEAMEALRISAKGAAAGLGDTQVVADALTSALIAYAGSNLSAAEAGDVLVGTVREGKAAAADFAPQFGRLLPMANELGISFGQVGGALAFLTRSSGDASLSATQLDAILRKLIKPSEQGAKELEAVGLSTDGLRASIRERGLLATLVELQDRLGGNSEALGKIFEEGTAVTGILQLTANGGNEAAGVIDRVTNSTGSLGKAFRSAADTDAFKARQALAEVQKSAIDLGSSLAPVGARVAGFVSGIASGFASLPEGTQNFALLSAGALALIGPLASAAGSVTRLGLAITELGAVGVGRAIAGIGAIGGIVGGAVLGTAAIGLAIAGLVMWLNSGSEAEREWAEAIREATKALLEQGEAGQKAVGTRVGDFFDELGDKGRTAMNVLDEMGVGFNDLTNAVRLGPGALQDWVNGVERAALVSGKFSPAQLRALHDSLVGLQSQFGQAGAEADALARGTDNADHFLQKFGASTALLTQNMALMSGQFAQTGTIHPQFVSGMTAAAAAARDYAKSVLDSTHNTEQASGALANMAGQLVGQAQALGMSEAQAAQYVAGLLGIPGNVSTTITSNADLQRLLVEGLAAQILGTPSEKDVTFHTNAAEQRANVALLAATMLGLPNPRLTITATGDHALAVGDNTILAINQKTGRVIIGGNPDPALGQLNATIGQINASSGTTTVDANTAPALAQIRGLDGQSITVTAYADIGPAIAAINRARVEARIAGGAKGASWRIPGFQGGGSPSPRLGSMFTVGEEGPELMSVGRGRIDVLSNPQSRHVLAQRGGGGVSGTESLQFAKAVAEFRQLTAELRDAAAEHRVAAAMFQAVTGLRRPPSRRHLERR